MKDYTETKEYLFKQITNPEVSKEDKSRMMSILTWIQEKEQKEKEFRELTVEQLYEIGLRLHKKFQSGLELK